MRSWRITSSSRWFLTISVVVALTMATLLATATSSWADIEPKRVLMLHSFGLRFKPWTDYAQLIRSGITRRSQTPVDFHDHSLLNARLADDKADGPFVDYLHALYADKPPDLIVAIGAPAANFVQRYRERIFPGTPMLFTAVEARRVQYDKLTGALRLGCQILRARAVVLKRRDRADAVETPVEADDHGGGRRVC